MNELGCIQQGKEFRRQGTIYHRRMEKQNRGGDKFLEGRKEGRTEGRKDEREGGREGGRKEGEEESNSFRRINGFKCSQGQRE